jgi:hypothetical protein
MADRITVTPAYGRDYNSKAKALADWNADKDFTVASVGPDMGRAVNKAQAEPLGLIVTIRYRRQTMAVVVNPDGTERR